jgi:nitronate monooxygenase
MKLITSFTQELGIEFPVLMAPMFLVSNEQMMKSAIDNGIAGCFPTLNYRNEGELDSVLKSLNDYISSEKKAGTYGVNIIVQQSNPLADKHLEICVKNRVPFYVTSLGSPKKVIEAARTYGAKVFCDVTNMTHADKCAELGCDGFIAVGQGAGGHAGNNPLQVLVPALKKKYPNKIVIAAGGIASGDGILSALSLGAEGVSLGTIFIASKEATVSEDYKQAIVDSGMDNIVMTTKISGTPCSIVDTPYAKKIGYEQTWLEKFLSKNSTTKKYFKMLVQLRGMKNLEKSIKPASYQTLWVVGKSAEFVHEILPVSQIIENLKKELLHANEQLQKKI